MASGVYPHFQGLANAMGVVGRWRPGVFGETADMCENSCFFPQKMGSGIVVMLLVAAVGPRDGFELEF